MKQSIFVIVFSVVGTTTAHAASVGLIGNDTFNVSASSIFGGTPPFDIGSASGAAQSVAGDCDTFSQDGCDVIFVEPSTGFHIGIDFIDGDTFDLSIFAQNVDLFEEYDITVVLSSLNFLSTIDSSPVAIDAVTFLPDGRGFSDFLQNSGNPDGVATFDEPSISFADDSISITLLSY
ncbi:hypothetical protein [Roseobacter sinensis]|uniref:Uncharacterized protein n=1 Tax=Roseobacter sinensis TaxID=2931391 RepID=A0ABT3BKS2_9RHOB|nr:hypothetical protein [Roseobacter sp. WL0113]MCV3274173.1 hypothetical protein [Roseobacter sp. WL0113]